MAESIESKIISITGAERVIRTAELQSLWSGYGRIVRYFLDGGRMKSVIVKHVSPPTQGKHPRGWNTDISHHRKLKSYQVEAAWYSKYSRACSLNSRVPSLLGYEDSGDQLLLILEDLDAAGFPKRLRSVNEDQLFACIRWLAHFHAQFLGYSPEGLWERGTYWHLDTRPDELKVLKDEDFDLYEAAKAIDARLNSSRFKTLVHGDAKLANFCFPQDGTSVAAVDFQYIGGGCGVQDLAYFVGSCLDENSCKEHETKILDSYFSILLEALSGAHESSDLDALEHEWRGLYPVAWTDFHRFLKGWSPGHWKVNTYSETVARKVIQSIQAGS
ncbi:MAG: phosphotransferase [Opitutales bacterium]